MGSSISKRSMRGSRWRVIGEHSRRGKPLCLILCPIFRTLDACQARYFARLQANSCDQCEESWGERLCPICVRTRARSVPPFPLFPRVRNGRVL